MAFIHDVASCVGDGSGQCCVEEKDCVIDLRKRWLRKNQGLAWIET